MVVIVQIALKPIKHVIHVGKSSLLEFLAGIDRAMTAAANQHNGPRGARHLLYLLDKVRVDIPIRSVIPADVHRADRMPHKQILHLAAAIDKHRMRSLLKKFKGVAGRQMLHSQGVFLQGRQV